MDYLYVTTGHGGSRECSNLLTICRLSCFDWANTGKDYWHLAEQSSHEPSFRCTFRPNWMFTWATFPICSKTQNQKVGSSIDLIELPFHWMLPVHWKATYDGRLMIFFKEILCLLSNWNSIYKCSLSLPLIRFLFSFDGQQTINVHGKFPLHFSLNLLFWI